MAEQPDLLPGTPAGPDGWERVVVSAETLALFFGCEAPQIWKYARESDLPKRRAGEFPLVECVRWRLRRQQAAGTNTTTEARRRLLEAQAVQRETENQVRAGELVEIERVASVLNGVLANLGTQLDGLAPRLAGILAAIDDPAAIQRTIMDETRSIRRAAAEAVATVGSGEISRGDPAPAPEPKRRRVGRRAPRPAAGEPGAGAVAD
ncbi:MAG: hypothetical protein J0M16_00460 [Gammaproteobacteria bacterium]|nr:hypothetical protein [Gammaproteobacteria bacterium]